MTTALGVPPLEDGTGTTPLALRQVIGALFSTVGIVSGLDVTTGTDLTYNVASGVAVCTRGDADGKTLAYFEGGSTPAVEAGDATFGRIDAIWVMSHDSPEYTDDGNNSVVLGVTSGAPSASPQAPTLPAGATLLAEYLLPARATSTQGATEYSNGSPAIPYGGNLGALVFFWDQSGNDASNPYNGQMGKSHYRDEMQETKYVPTDRLLEFTFQCNYSATDSKNPSEYVAEFMLDGSPLDHSAQHFASSGTWESHEGTFLTHVQKGTHTFGVRTWWNAGSRPIFHYSANSDNQVENYIGRRFYVFDRGPGEGLTQIGR